MILAFIVGITEYYQLTAGYSANVNGCGLQASGGAPGDGGMPSPFWFVVLLDFIGDL